jgi:hypothetical protein
VQTRHENIADVFAPCLAKDTGGCLSEPGKEASLDNLTAGNPVSGRAAKAERTPLAVENSVGELTATAPQKGT